MGRRPVRCQNHREPAGTPVSGPACQIIGGVFATLLFGAFITRFSKWPLTEGTLAAASTAICGASAAIALAATFNHKQLREQALLAIVVTVTALSTLAMVLYPFISGWCGFDHIDAGIFLGGTIHDVAQVVGAGAMIGPDALEIASLTEDDSCRSSDPDPHHLHVCLFL